MNLIAKHYRLSKNLNQKKMSQIIGCSQATYCKFEAGKQKLKETHFLSILKTIIPGLLTELYRLDAEAELYLTNKGPRGKVINNRGDKYV